MRLIVTGGRDMDRASVFAQLDAIHALTPVEVIIEGGEGGAPALAASWARVRGVSAWRVPADEARFGVDAFALRDIRMFEMCQPDLVLMLPGGTPLHYLARLHGVRVRHPVPPGADPNQTDFLAAA